MLPGDVLLEISDFYMHEHMDEHFESPKRQRIEGWITLAHVCRRWRSVVFQSPRRLNLRLFCTRDTPARDTLDIWPRLPLVISDFVVVEYNEPSRVDNIIAALEHNDRVCQIDLINDSSSELADITNSAGMREPFPELTDLYLWKVDGPELILPDSFLGRTAPRLRSLELIGVAFPGLPKLLLPTTQLVDLRLSFIPRSGYITPETMATSLSALTSLRHLRLHFQYPQPRPALESRRPPPPLPPLTRSILLSLTYIQFKGAYEYLEEILARIDAPRLNKLHITFFNQIMFDTPQLFQFISRRPTLRAPEKGHIEFDSEAIIVKFPSQTSDYEDKVLSAQILCSVSEWQLSSLGQVCTSSLPPVSTLEDLYISEKRNLRPHWQDDVENMLWLDLLRSFVVVKNLYVSEGFVPRIAPALQELVGGRTTEVLPTLENIFLEGLLTSGPLQDGIEKFVTARQLANLPVTVSRWDRDSK